jgi:hypothetical protein
MGCRVKQFSLDYFGFRDMAATVRQMFLKQRITERGPLFLLFRSTSRRTSSGCNADAKGSCLLAASLQPRLNPAVALQCHVDWETV